MSATLSRFVPTQLLRPNLKWTFSHRALGLTGLLLLAIALSQPKLASAERIVRKDIDQDGHVDQVAHYDNRGKLLLLELDSNGDGVMDRFQHYKGPELTRVEGDLDDDGKIDVKDFYEKGRRRLQEQLDPSGKVRQRARFDDQDNPLSVAQDTTTDGRLDTEWRYEHGQIVTAQHDTDGDGKADIWNAYRNGKAVSAQVDKDNDGQPDSEIIIDTENAPTEGFLVEDADIEGASANAGGIITLRSDNSPIPTDLTNADATERILRQDRNNDGQPDVTTWLVAGVRKRQTQDTNFDGRDDLTFTFNAEGLLVKAEVDTRHDGKINLIRTFDKEVPLKDHLDSDNDGRLDTTVDYENGRMVRQTRDKNQDGQPDIMFWFDRQELRRKVESDSDFNGSIDTRYFYEDGDLRQMDRDEDGNGIPEMRIYYRDKEKKKLLNDKNQDGHFETIQWYAVAGWEQVVEVDRDGDGFADERTYFQDGRPARREQDSNADGLLERVEWLNNDKHVSDRRNWPPGKGVLNIIWPVDDTGQPHAKASDSNGDGQPDTWEHFSNQHRVARIVDRNLDGRPDAWEIFAPDGHLVEKRLDDDYDGIPDTSTLE
jgi:antitoxin component YwqK of YwqJK toxin-antitoxin module